MLANEMFLDSASLRSSIVSHAKMLGYEVSSPRAPIATINVSLTTTNATATMSAGTTFNTTVDGVNLSVCYYIRCNFKKTQVHQYRLIV